MENWISTKSWIIGLISFVAILAMKYLELKMEAKQKAKGDTTDYSKAYQPRNLLTQNEWNNYLKLKEVANTKGLLICPKVRLLDIVEPRRRMDYKKLLYKIQSKHVDFVICDQFLHIKAIIELDDSSHDRKDRQERDKFVDTVLTGVGHKVIHTRQITDDILSHI